MRIWSDLIGSHPNHITAAKMDARIDGTNVDVEHFTDKARKRKYRIDVRLEGFGERHTRYRNWGTSQGARDETMAATWMDWGWFIAVLFRFDPDAVIGQYDGRDDFHRQTAHEWTRRLANKDRSVVGWCNSRYGLDEFGPGYSPFADLSHRSPNHLVNLQDLDQVDAWLS